MRYLPVLAFLLTALAAPVYAQSADAPEPSPLAALAGTWQIEVGETPIGVVTGTLLVRADGTGLLTLNEMAVADAPVVGLAVSAGDLVGDVPEVYSSVAGMWFVSALRLTPDAAGGLTGVLDVEGDTTYPMTARRSAE